ncbi:type II toxin-antitoxin system RelE/ParE family toxin [Nonomuraea salmonea]|uniref:Type II toxin-antitoxin system RelE/ParE family toxin n=1 Tax=Nonomuraea salmonea TaxID=46181 RepID=A0ABV5NW53_9ACTN
MLAARPTTLGEPYSRHLGGEVRELRFILDGNAVRITYWLAPEQRIILLTVFRKTRQREEAEVERARQAQKVCEAEHGPAEHTYDRRRRTRREPLPVEDPTNQETSGRNSGRIPRLRRGRIRAGARTGRL